MERKRVSYIQTARGLVPVYAKGVVEQIWDSYSETDHATWSQLLNQIKPALEGRACSSYLKHLQQLNFDQFIPRFTDINAQLAEKTGWKIVAVDGLLSDADFFTHLAHRQFPVSWWIRSQHQMDYLPEPDLFHDLVGHVPMLFEPQYAQAVELFGKKALSLLRIDPPLVLPLARLYWFTVEFGLIQEKHHTRIMGAGILSSKGESEFSLDPSTPRQILDIEKAIRSDYRIDQYQDSYFVAKSLEQVFQAIDSMTAKHCREALQHPDPVDYWDEQRLNHRLGMRL